MIPSVRIDVNPDSPVENREFLVYKLGRIPDVTSTKDTWSGFAIIRQIDLRYTFDINRTWFSGHVVQKNKLLIKFPAWQYPLRSDEDLPAIDDWAAKKNKAYIADGLKAARNTQQKMANAANGDEEVDSTHYLLVFPDEMELSASIIYAEAGLSEECDLDILPIKSQPLEVHYDPAKRKKKDNSTHYVVFTVGRKDLGVELNETVKGKGHSMPKAAKAIEGTDTDDLL